MNDINTYVGIRHKLNEAQRQKLKAAYYSLKEQENATPRTLPGSTISVETQTQLESRLGMSDLVVRDLIHTRESLGLPMLLRMQKVLGTEILTREDCMKACESYLDYVFKSDD